MLQEQIYSLATLQCISCNNLLNWYKSLEKHHFGITIFVNMLLKQQQRIPVKLCNQLATENQTAHIASLQYSNLAVNISKKAVQRLDVDIKRTICKACRSILIPGITCRVRIKKKKIIKRCLKCRQAKSFNVKNRKYMTWSQKDESLVELLDYTPSESTNLKNKEGNE